MIPSRLFGRTGAEQKWCSVLEKVGNREGLGQKRQGEEGMNVGDKEQWGDREQKDSGKSLKVSIRTKSRVGQSLLQFTSVLIRPSAG